MLQLLQSNDLESLADDLIRRWSADAGLPLLRVESVVVQSPGMATWLRHRVAEECGIAAGIDFPLPSGFLWQVVRAVCTDADDASVFDKTTMTWRLFAILEDLPADAIHAPLHRYLEGEPRTLKRFQLAGRIADLFDQYLIYRPDWMAAWRSGEDAGDVGSDESWQPSLWRRLVETLGDVADRGQLVARATQRLLGGRDGLSDPSLDGLPSRVFVFALSAMPPPQLALLFALARHVDVYLYVFNPCAAFWSDIVSERFKTSLAVREAESGETSTSAYYETGHPLLASMGLAGRDFIDLLIEFGEDLADEGRFFNEDDFEVPHGSGLLAHLQRDVLELDALGWPRAVAHDGSLTFAPAWGVLREVEVLHDWLLARFEQDPGLKPRDVVVLIPDIESYAPAIEAVFGASVAGANARLPFTIADRDAGSESDVLAALRLLLRAAQGRWTRSEVIGLLENPAVAARLGCSEADLEQLAWWIESAGVRWGRDGEHWQQLGFPIGGWAATTDLLHRQRQHASTWAFGTDRMLLGFAMGGEAPAFRDTLPLAGVEGAETEALAVLLTLLERMNHYAWELARPRTAPAWADLLDHLITDLIDEASEPGALDGVRETLASLRAVETEEALPWDVIDEALRPRFAAAGGAHRFLAGGISFCTLMPMRTIPFRLVCMLGMNDGVYPRIERPPGFDLMSPRPRKGDRSRRLEDRYLFLEALLSARDALYIGWTGRDPATDSICPPSVLVSELEEVITRSFELVDEAGITLRGPAVIDALTIESPLQPFSGRYTAADAGPTTYSTLWAGSDSGPAPVGELPPIEPVSSVALSEILVALRDPAAFTLSQRLGTRFVALDASSEDDEPFRLDGLERWDVRRRGIEAMLAGRSLDAWQHDELVAGHLPLAATGRAVAREVAAWVREHQPTLDVFEFVEFDSPPPAVCLPDGPEVVFDLDEFMGGNRWVRTGKVNERDRMRLWLAQLAISAAGMRQPLWLLDSSHVYCAPALDAHDAQESLAELLTVVNALRDAPQPLLCASSAAFVGALAKGEGEEQAIDRARASWEPGWDGRAGEGDQPANRKCWPVFPADDPAHREHFMVLSIQVWRAQQDGIDRQTHLEFRKAHGGTKG